MLHPSVLVVDADEDTREILERALPHVGHRVTAVPSGDAALALLREHPFALVITEMYLPAGGHPCVLEAIRRDAALRDQPVLVYTTFSTADDRAWSARWQCDGYIVKPAHLDVLFDTVRGITERSGARERTAGR